MSFLSSVFLIFLPATVLIWLYLQSRDLKNGGNTSEYFLLAASLFFYGWYAPWYLVLFLSVAAVAFYTAHYFRRIPLWAAVLILLSPLIYFKYKDFVLQSVFLTDPARAMLLPLGISFFTFQSIAYVTDVRKGMHTGFPQFRRFLLFLSFFPQLVAGPIVLARHFRPFFEKTLPREEDWKEGMFYLISGYFKKAVFADRLALSADPVFADPAMYGSEWLWLGIIAYSLQIYFDFSGYSDIAVGAGLLFGIRLPENFRFPYHAVSFRDFWRRWHITLSSWLRDYIYIPLGGSRNGSGRMTAALMITMILGGIWHGAHWNFLIWGAAHGLLLTAERFLQGSGSRDKAEFLKKSLQRFFTLSMIGMLWVLFRTGSETDGFLKALQFYQGLAGQTGIRPASSDPLFVTAAVMMHILSIRFYERIKLIFLQFTIVFAAIAAALSAVAVTLLSVPSASPFIYFVF